LVDERFRLAGVTLAQGCEKTVQTLCISL